MGSGERGDTASRPVRRQGLLSSSGSPIINCDIRARVAADASETAVEPAEGELVRDGANVVLVVGGTRAAVLRDAATTEKIAVCLARGQRFVGRMSTVEGRVVVDVRPDVPSS